MNAFKGIRKTIVTLSVAVCAFVACAGTEKATKTLADARNEISAIIEDPSKMSEIITALSAEDQVTFLGEINQAIARLPGSVESRTATLLNVDSAALRSAKQGNLSNMVAEVFATAFPEALPVLSDRFAEDLFNRDAVQNKPNDLQYAKIARDTMDAVNKRVSEVDGGDVRSTFAALMFIKAAGSLSDNLYKEIAATVPEKSRDAALAEWLPEALGKEGKEQSYDALMAAINADVIPEITRTLEIAGPQFQAVLLSDLTGYNTEPMTKATERTPITDAIFNNKPLGRPIGGNSKMDDLVTPHSGGGTEEPEQPEPPKPYEGQTLH